MNPYFCGLRPLVALCSLFASLTVWAAAISCGVGGAGGGGVVTLWPSSSSASSS